MNPEKFRKIRNELGLKQDELAEILCVSQPAVISHYEAGFRTPSKMLQVVMSILESLSEKKRKEFIDLIKSHSQKLGHQVRKASRGK